MAPKAPQSEALHEAISNILPEKTEVVMSKYRSFLASDIAMELADLDDDAKSRIYNIAEEIIEENRFSEAAAKTKEQRAELVKKLDAELDTISSTFDLAQDLFGEDVESNMKDFEALKKVVLIYFSGKTPSGETVATLKEKFLDLRGRLDALGKLDEKSEKLRKKYIEFLDWNLGEFEIKLSRKGLDLLSADELVAELDALAGEGPSEEPVDKEAEKEHLNWLLSNVIFLSHSESKNLPKDASFYKELMSLVEKQLSGASALGEKAQLHGIMGQLNVLKSHAEYAAYFSPGKAIWQYYTANEGITGIRASFREDFVGSTDSSEYRGSDESDHNFIGVIDEVDIYTGSIRFEGKSDWHAMKSFEDKIHYFGTREDMGSSTIYENIEGRTEWNGELKIHRSEDKTREYMNLAQREGFNSFLLKVAETTKFQEMHIPKNNLLRKFIEKGWVSLNNEAMLISSFCPANKLSYAYKMVLQQKDVEDIWDGEAKLEMATKVEIENDPFYNLRLNFVTSQRQVAMNDIYAAKNTLVKFLDDLKKTQSDSPDLKIPSELIEGKKFALLNLKLIYLRAVDRMSQVAISIFGAKEEYKVYLKRVLERLAHSKKLLNDGKEFEKLVDRREGLKALDNRIWQGFYINEDRPSGLISGDAAIYASEELNIPYFPISSKSNPSMSESNEKERYNYRTGTVTSRGALRGKELVTKSAKYEDEHTPPSGVIKLWNELARFELPSAYSKYADSEKRLQKFREMAKKLRVVDGGKAYKESYDPENAKLRDVYEKSYINPEAAEMYARDALGDKIADAEFELMEVKDRLMAQEKRNMAKYRKQARDAVEYMLDNSLDLEIKLISQGLLTKEEFAKAKAELKSGKGLNLLADTLVSQYVDGKVKKMVYDKFANGQLTGADQKMWKMIDDMVGHTGTFNFSDRTAHFLTGELIEMAIVTVASMGIGSFIASGARLGWVALGGARAAQIAETGNMAYRLGSMGTEALGFTLAEKSIRSVFLQENTWGSFAGDLGHNILMFGAIHTGGHIWKKVAGKFLVGETEGLKLFETVASRPTQEISSKWFEAAGDWGKRGLKTLDYAGSLGMEVGVFSSLGIAEKMVGQDYDLDDLNIVKGMAMNTLTIIALHGGGFAMRPAYSPMTAKIETRRTRLMEDMAPRRFLANNGLTSFSSATRLGEAPKSATPEAIRLHEARLMEGQRADMARYRNFIDAHGFRTDIFKGKSGEEAERVMSKVDGLLGKQGELISHPPSAEALAELAISEPVVAELVVSKMEKLDLNGNQIARIFNKNPQFLQKFADKLPEGPSIAIKLVEKLGLKADASSDTFMAKSESELLTAYAVLKSHGFEIANPKGKSLEAKIGDYTIKLDTSVNARFKFNQFIDETGNLKASALSPESGSALLTLLRAPKLRKVFVNLYAAGTFGLGAIGAYGSARAAERPAVESVQRAVEISVLDSFGIKAPDGSKLKRGSNSSEIRLTEPDRAGPDSIKDATSTEAKKVFEKMPEASRSSIVASLKRAGAPKEAIDMINDTYKSIPEAFKPYIRVLPAESGGNFAPKIIVNQKALNDALGRDINNNPYDTGALLKDLGLVSPETLSDVATISGLSDVDVTMAGTPLEGVALLLLAGGGFWGWSKAKTWWRRRTLKGDMQAIGLTPSKSEAQKPVEKEQAAESLPVSEQTIKSTDLRSSLKEVLEIKKETGENGDPMEKLSESSKDAMELLDVGLKELAKEITFDSNSSGVKLFKTITQLRYLNLRVSEARSNLESASPAEKPVLEKELLTLEKALDRTINSFQIGDFGIVQISAKGMKSIKSHLKTVLENLSVDKSFSPEQTDALKTFLKFVNKSANSNRVREIREAEFKLEMQKRHYKSDAELKSLKVTEKTSEAEKFDFRQIEKEALRYKEMEDHLARLKKEQGNLGKVVDKLKAVFGNKPKVEGAVEKTKESAAPKEGMSKLKMSLIGSGIAALGYVVLNELFGKEEAPAAGSSEAVKNGLEEKNRTAISLKAASRVEGL